MRAAFALEYARWRYQSAAKSLSLLHAQSPELLKLSVGIMKSPTARLLDLKGPLLHFVPAVDND